MTLTIKGKPYIIPEYSLTGDLLSYLTCGLQYRFNNRGALPPSKPVQLWFGEFIHAVMEESYVAWKEGKREFPWDWLKDIRPIELEICKRMEGKGIRPDRRLFCKFEASEDGVNSCPDADHPHKLLVSRRVEAAINTWGPYLFPLIEEAEIKLKHIRHMPHYVKDVSRSNYYSINGVIDVISSVNLETETKYNQIIRYLNDSMIVNEKIEELSTKEYEIIIDYKGMRRPHPTSQTWKYHEWQIQTYTWLRSKIPGSKPVVAGIIFYLNELEPSRNDALILKKELEKEKIDLNTLTSDDIKNISKWNSSMGGLQISDLAKEQRSIRIIPILDKSIDYSLTMFDDVIYDIENSILNETSSDNILECWKRTPEPNTCTACDFKSFCPDTVVKYKPKVPWK